MLQIQATDHSGKKYSGNRKIAVTQSLVSDDYKNHFGYDQSFLLRELKSKLGMQSEII